MNNSFPEGMFRSLVDNLGTGVLVDDSNGKIHYANRAFRQIFGLESSQVNFFDFADLTAPEHRNDLLKLHLRRLSGKTAPESVDFTGLRTDGTRVPLEASVSMIQQGEKIFFLTMLRDMSEFHSANTAKTQNDAFRMSHRICMSILESPGMSDCAEKLREKMTFPDKNLLHPVVLADAGLFVLQTAGFIQDIGNRHIHVAVSVDPDLPQVKVSERLLQHVLRNAARNAIEASEEQGRITLRAGYEERINGSAGSSTFVNTTDWVYIEIQDEGTGMTQETMERAPEPFFTTRDRELHSGIGLFEVFQGMKVMKGYATLSSAPGSGTVIRMFIPGISKTE